MKVFRVDIDPNIFQSIFPDVSDEDVLLYSEFDCTEVKHHWKSVEWYIFNPRLKKGNFFSLEHGGALAFDKTVKNSDLFPLLEMAGEIIEIEVKGEIYYILNVLNCIDALDESRTTFHYYSNGGRGRIISYAFNHNRVTECPIFKIPQTSKAEILIRSPFSDSDDFMTLYKRNSFVGLTFNALY